MESMQAVLGGYAAARARYVRVPDLGDNSDPAIKAVRIDLLALFRSVVESRPNKERYKVSASVGEYPLNMAAIPWVAAFRTDVTTGARKGYYVVLLFSEDGASAVLSLNQGFHSFLQEYKPIAAAERKARAVANFAASILDAPAGFERGEIDLKASGGLGQGYQRGAILSKVYLAPATFSEDQFRSDVKAALDAYDELVRIAGPVLTHHLPPLNNDEFQAAVQEESKAVTAEHSTSGPQPKPRMLARQGRTVYTRDPKVAARALAAAGYRCALATDTFLHVSFLARSNGKNYVEAHHVVPMSRQSEFTYSLDVEANVAALCPNCHRQVHLGRPADKRKILSQLLAARSSGLLGCGIRVDLEQLCAYYEALSEED